MYIFCSQPVTYQQCAEILTAVRQSLEVRWSLVIGWSFVAVVPHTTLVATDHKILQGL